MTNSTHVFDGQSEEGFNDSNDPIRDRSDDAGQAAASQCEKTTAVADCDDQETKQLSATLKYARYHSHSNSKAVFTNFTLIRVRVRVPVRVRVIVNTMIRYDSRV